MTATDLPAALWLLVPSAPLLAWILVLCWPQRTAPWLWLSCIPALATAAFPPAPLILPGLWPDAQWGDSDLITRAFLAFSALLWACASLYAWGSHSQDPQRLRFWTCWLLSLSGNLLLIIAGDGASFYVGFTLMSLAAYGLVVHRVGPGPRRAGRLYLQLAVLGEMLLYAGLLLRAHEAGGSAGFSALQGAPLGSLTAGLLLLGFGLKAGFWPLHLWLPQAHPAAPAAASAVLSGAMIKAGILGLWRFMPEHDPLLQSWALPLFALGLFSALFGVVVGLLQHKTKTALAYSSVSQMGYLLAIVAAAWAMPEQREFWAGALAIYAVHHGLAKGALFMGAGLAGPAGLRWPHLGLLTVPALALAGLPLSSGGAAKIVFKEGLTETFYAPALTLLSLGSLATALLMARVLYLVRPRDTHDGPAKLAGRVQLYPWIMLCLLPLLWPWLWALTRTTGLTSLQFSAVVALLWPLAVAIALALLARYLAWPQTPRKLPQPALLLSAAFTRALRRPLTPNLQCNLTPRTWRDWERRWNRLWHSDSVTTSSALVSLLLLLIWWLS